MLTETKSTRPLIQIQHLPEQLQFVETEHTVLVNIEAAPVLIMEEYPNGYKEKN
jgi:hypothetical protein